VNGNDIVADFIQNISWETLPKEVQEKAKLCLLDTIGAIIVGTLLPITKIATNYVNKLWPENDESTIFLSKKRSSAIGAAFVNGCAANASDIDDNGKYTRGHPGAQIIPVALSISEKLDISGKETLIAIITGYEVAHRIGRCWHDYHKIYQACGSWGSVANAAVAAKLMGLDHKKIKNALGIADYYAPNVPIMRDLNHPAMVKHGIGWGAMTGIVSAGLAAEGFTATPSILGFKQYKEWVSTIGSEYIMLDGVTFKKYASCSWGHPPFITTLKLINKYKIKIKNILKIKITGFHRMVCLVVKHPKTEEEAQFSVAWPLAALLIDGEIGPKQMLQNRFNDPKILNLANKIELVESKEMTKLYHSNHYPCAIEITLKDGKKYDSGIVDYASGGLGSSEDNNFRDLKTEEEVKNKFCQICNSVIDNNVIEKCLNFIEDFENLPKITPLTQLLSGSNIKNE
jgi:2-methylcitrate dehydratase PrpD